MLVFGQVGDDEVELVQVFTRQRLFAVARRHHFVAELLQDLLQHGAQLIVVVNDEDSSSLH
jgi:hypothetical protein